MSGVALSMLQVNGKQLEMGFWPGASSNGAIVLLHEALGSVSYWKDFPEKLASVTGYDVVAYSRAGHGESEGPVEPRNVEYYQNQIDIVVPAVLAHFHVEQPVLYGHSEGAAIAFLYAARHHSVRAVVAECPIVMQEDRTVQAIVELAAAYPMSDMSRRLGRYHRDADAVFDAWMQSNRGTVFKDFPMHQYLVQVRCPVMVLQGSRDEFGSVRQFESLQKSVPLAKHVVLEAGHLLHREQPDLVVKHVQAFLSKTSPADHGANNHPKN